jgi:hypothetical protein
VYTLPVKYNHDIKIINASGRKNESLTGLLVIPVAIILAPEINELLTITDADEVWVPASVLVIVALLIIVETPYARLVAGATCAWKEIISTPLAGIVPILIPEAGLPP